MRMKLRIVIASALVAASLVWSGCAGGVFSSTVWNPLGVPLPSLDPDPVRIGIVTESQSLLQAAVWWDLGHKEPYAELQQRLSARLLKSVQIEPMTPFQVAAHLQSGRLDFAMLSPEAYVEACKEGHIGEIVATAEPSDRRGVIVARADSKIESLAQIKGQRFAFGPHGDAALHYGVLAVLSEAGIAPKDLGLEVLPVGALQHHISSTESAKEVAYGLGTPAGVMDAAEFDKLPDTGGRMINPLAPSFSKDQFRELARTPPAAACRFVAGPNVDAALKSKVESFLLSADKAVVSSLGLKAFTAPDSDGAGPSAKR